MTAPASVPRPPTADAAPTAAPVLVVHGGAGDWLEGTAAGVRACIEAAEAGVATLAQGSALDAVIAAVRVLEDAPACNAGTGAVLTRDGKLELDACVMDGATLASGAVACLPAFRHPIDVARAVLDDGRYHLLVGEGAARFAVGQGIDPSDERQMIRDARLGAGDAAASPRAGNTVGAVALDGAGRLAAATSTGGVAGTDPGRVGDSPIVGAGTFANGDAACSCTGDGEAFARTCTAFWVVQRAEQDDVEAAARLGLARVDELLGGRGGLIVVNSDGSVGIARSMPLMPHAIARPGAPVTAAT